MKILLVIQLILWAAAAVFLVVAYRQRNKNILWFSFRVSPLKYCRRESFIGNGFEYYCAFVVLFFVGGSAGTIYWLTI